MTVKINLTLKPETVKKAKEYAKRKNRSLSNIVESYLETLVTEDPSQQAFSPEVESLAGSLNAPANTDDKTALQEALSKKYL